MSNQMFKCANTACSVRVSYRGDLCGMCREQPVDDFDYDDEGEIEREDDDEEHWACAYPGKCLMPAEHCRDECHTVEDAEAYYEEMRETEQLG